jgi:pyruvate dehydrogenase E2 component (dihydrolipoamide acetyltransferase)
MPEVVMPQMGESIAEGTIVRWIKKVGDRVDRDEPLFEISTDKVDAEIPSPAAGVLLEVRAQEGETVPVHAVVAVIGDGVATVAPPRPAPASEATVASVAPDAPVAPAGPAGRDAGSALRRVRSSPLVRRIARDHGVDLAGVAGTGLGGRVTKGDILHHLGPDPRPAPSAAGGSPALPHGHAGRPDDRVEVVPMSVMRRKIAEHMVLSRRTSAHVHSVFEVDYERVSAIRAARKADYERQGVKLTFLSFLMKAAVDAIKAVPVINSSIDGDNVVYKKDINLGIAVALEWGLLVPVIRHAGEMSVLELSRAAQELAARARAKQLKPEEVQGGTFTITNPGAVGAQFGLPIISQPQVAIMGVGTIEKRVAVVDGSAIGIRAKGYLTLGFDHRLIDGAVADTFMSLVKTAIEHFEPDTV